MNDQTKPETNVLVTRIGDQPCTTTLIIAKGVGRPHHGVIQLVRQHQRDFEQFGGVAFEMRPFMTAGGEQKQEYAILNERQATLLLTYMRNSQVVRKFKIALVLAFFAMAEIQRITAADGPALRQCAQCRQEAEQMIWQMQCQLLAQVPLWRKIRAYHQKCLSCQDIATLVKLSPKALRRQMREMSRCGLLWPATERELARMRVAVRHKSVLAMPYGPAARQDAPSPMAALLGR
ncbi:MAG: Rha family transcriptional regulator [Desulfobulbus sp.]|nr:Rha family transcriptional regulator [Desulfobulbus sp.]